MSYIGTQPNDVKKNIGLYTPSEILDLTNVENGIYFLSISTEGKVFNKRIIKE